MENLVLLAFLAGCGVLIFVTLAFPNLGPEQNVLALAYNDLQIGISQEAALKTIKNYFSKNPHSSYPVSAEEDCEVWCWRKQDGWLAGRAFLEVEFNENFDVQEVRYFYASANFQGLKMLQWKKSLEPKISLALRR